MHPQEKELQVNVNLSWQAQHAAMMLSISPNPGPSDFQAPSNAASTKTRASPRTEYRFQDSEHGTCRVDCCYAVFPVSKLQMAADSTEPQPAGTPAPDSTTTTTPTTPTVPPKQFPKGVVLGKDGKP